jgi:tRNA threonylcarbamoyladenosine biosynthesis protein TsaB
MTQTTRAKATISIETSGRAGTVALFLDDEFVEERPLRQAGRRHAQTLVLEIADLLQSQDLQPADCGLVAVSIGPGSFTGLRVGVVFAKTFAYANRCCVVAVDTFQAVAEGCDCNAENIIVVGEAQRNDVYVGQYLRESAGGFVRQGTLTIKSVPEFCGSFDQITAAVVTGPAIEKVQSELPSGTPTISADVGIPRAEWIGRIGLRMIQAGQEDDVWTLEPFYLRKSAAEEKWDARNPSQ